MQLAHLNHTETVRLDTKHLNTIFTDPGRDHGAQAIHAAAEDLARATRTAVDLWHAGDHRDLRRCAIEIARKAADIGSPTLVHVATVVTGLCHSRNDTALAATVHRMMRLGEESLIAIRDAPDLSL